MSAEDKEGGGVAAVEPLRAPAAVAYDPGGKSPQEIEGDIMRTRAQLGEILDALERQLGPRQLLARGADVLKDAMSGNAGKIGEVLRDNPVPLALIGAGVGWLLISGSGSGGLGSYGGALRSRVSDTMRDIGQRAGDLAGQVKEKAAGAASMSDSYATGSSGYAYGRPKSGDMSAGPVRNVAAKASGAVGAASRRAGDYMQQAGDRLGGARERFDRVLADHPLAVGALGFLAGALIASLLPATEAEERWMRPAREGVREQAGDVGRQAVERAQQVADQAVDVAADTAKDIVGAASGKRDRETEDHPAAGQSGAPAGPG